jgi:hypothetical protein
MNQAGFTCSAPHRSPKAPGSTEASGGTLECIAKSKKCYD